MWQPVCLRDYYGANERGFGQILIRFWRHSPSQEVIMINSTADKSSCRLQFKEHGFNLFVNELDSINRSLRAVALTMSDMEPWKVQKLYFCDVMAKNPAVHFKKTPTGYDGAEASVPSALGNNNSAIE